MASERATLRGRQERLANAMYRALRRLEGEGRGNQAAAMILRSELNLMPGYAALLRERR